MNDAKALLKLQHGSERALGYFIDKYNAYVSTVVYNIIGADMGQGDIEECVSDVFMALWENAHKLGPDSIKPWLGAVARNAAKKKRRQQKPELPLEDDIISIPQQGPEQCLEMAEQRQILRKALWNMPPQEREIFIRFYYYGQRAKLIAAQMDINASTVRSRLARGREKLRRMMEEEYQEGGL